MHTLLLAIHSSRFYIWILQKFFSPFSVAFQILRETNVLIPKSDFTDFSNAHFYLFLRNHMQTQAGYIENGTFYQIL